MQLHPHGPLARPQRGGDARVVQLRHVPQHDARALLLGQRAQHAHELGHRCTDRGCPIGDSGDRSRLRSCGQHPAGDGEGAAPHPGGHVDDLVAAADDLGERLRLGVAGHLSVTRVREQRSPQPGVDRSVDRLHPGRVLHPVPHARPGHYQVPPYRSVGGGSPWLRTYHPRIRRHCSRSHCITILPPRRTHRRPPTRTHARRDRGGRMR